MRRDQGKGLLVNECHGSEGDETTQNLPMTKSEDGPLREINDEMARNSCDKLNILTQPFPDDDSVLMMVRTSDPFMGCNIQTGGLKPVTVKEIYESFGHIRTGDFDVCLNVPLAIKVEPPTTDENDECGSPCDYLHDLIESAGFVMPRDDVPASDSLVNGSEYQLTPFPFPFLNRLRIIEFLFVSIIE